MDGRDFPTEPIGGKNPYYRCSLCKLSVPEINGEVEAHLVDCDYRMFKQENGDVPYEPLVEWEVRYVACDGEVRHTTVMARGEDDAKLRALAEDTHWCDGSIGQVIDASRA